MGFAEERGGVCCASAAGTIKKNLLVSFRDSLGRNGGGLDATKLFAKEKGESG